MKLHFTLTLEDFTTAQRLHRKPAPGAGPRMRERLLFLWLFLGAVFAVIAIAVGEGIYRAASGTLGRQARAADWMVHIVVQWSMYVLIFGFIWFGLSAWMDPRERGAYRRVIVILLSLLLLNSTVTTLITGLPPKQPQPTVVEGSSDGGWLLPLTPWLIILGYFWYIAFRYMRGAVR